MIYITNFNSFIKLSIRYIISFKSTGYVDYISLDDLDRSAVIDLHGKKEFYDYIRDLERIKYDDFRIIRKIIRLKPNDKVYILLKKKFLLLLVKDVLIRN